MFTHLTLSRILLLSFILLILLSSPPSPFAHGAKNTKKPGKSSPPPPPPAAPSGDVDDERADRVEPPLPVAAVAAEDEANDATPPLRGASEKAKVKKHVDKPAKAKKAGSKAAKAGKAKGSKAGTERSNGWLADLADAENVPYLLNIGTAKETANVIADDHTQPSYRPHVELKQGEESAADGTTEVGDVVDFYMWRRQTDDEVAGSKARSITMQRPVVFVQDSDVLDAAVQNWGTRSVRLLPALVDEAEPITFSLVTSCKKAGTTFVNVALRSFEVTSGARSRKNIEFSVKRTCEAAPVKEEANTEEAEDGEEDDTADPYSEANTEKGKSAPKAKAAASKKSVEPVDVQSAGAQFDINLIGADEQVQTVVTHGQPVAPFRLQQVKKGQDGEDALEPLYTVPTTQARIDLSIRYSGAVKRTLNKPLLYVAEQSIVTVTDNMGARVAMLHNDERKFSLTFNCLAEGKSTFTVILTIKEEPKQKVTFAMEKECGGSERTEGVAGIAVDVATAVSAHDVVDDGITLKPYSAIAKWDDKNWAHKADVVSVDIPSTVFYISTTKPDGYQYEQPVVTAFSEDGTVIAQPKVSGSVVTTDPLRLTPDEPLELVLEYRCEAEGVAGVTVSLPITEVGSVQWTLRKQCEKPTEDEQQQQQAADVEEKAEHEALGLSIDENNQTTPIPGLNIGFSRTAHGQMYNGVVEGMYRLQSSTDALAYCKSNRQFLTFYLYQNASVPGAVDVAYGKPELITTTDISLPILSGNLDGGVVNATSHASFTVTFHCLSDGNTMYTLTIPLLPLAPASKPPRSSITLTFLKNCNNSDSVLTVETGGVGIQGFRIGTTPSGNEVVHDGFPSIHYFGQKDRDDPNWNGIIVPESEVSSTFYLTYVGGENIGELILNFQPPLLASHSSLVKPELSGSAAQGGQILKNSAGLTLDITYNCRAAGLVPITVLLPINDGQIVFTIPKQCGGTVLPQGIVHKGLMVGVTEGGSEVVNDGLVSPAWASGRGMIIRDDEEETRFWIMMTEGVFQAVEPFVRAYRSIAQPTLSHDMYVSMGPEGELLQEPDDGEDSEEWDTESLLQALSDIAALRLNGSGQARSELAEDEFDDVYINSRPAQLNVSYACFDQGSTRVGITMPLKVGYLEWSWTKLCPRSPWAGVASIVPARADGEVNAAGGLWDNTDDQGVAAQGRIAGGDGNGWADNEVAVPLAGDDEEGRGSILPQPMGEARDQALVDGGDDADGDAEDEDFDTKYLIDKDRPLPEEELGGHHRNDPYEQHTDAESRDFARVETLVVASSLRLAQAVRGDIFHLNDGPRPKYKRPNSAAGLSNLAIIPADVDETSFFVATTKGTQAIRKPTVVVPSEVRRVGIDPRVELVSVEEGIGQQRVDLSRDDEPLEFVVEWRCTGQAGGVTPAIVSVPLVPAEAGVLRFYIGKMCPSDADAVTGSARSGRGWSLYAMLLVGVLASFSAMYYFGTKGGKEQLTSLVSQRINGTKGRAGDTLQRGEYEIVSQKVPRRREQDGI